MPYQPTVLVENRLLSPGTFVLKFADCAFLDSALPGQFVMLRGLDWGTDPLLPRAFSLLSVARGEVEILIKTTGKASARLEVAQPGASFSILGPLGNRFPAPAATRADWLIAGGVGLAPLLMHAEHAAKAGLKSQMTMFYGGRSAADLVMLERSAEWCGAVELTTDDGSRGQKGRVTAALLAALERAPTPPTLLACGPDPMLEAVARIAHDNQLSAYLSLEGEMACGIGACLVCAVPRRGHEKPFGYACVHGPVFPVNELAGRYSGEVAP